MRIDICTLFPESFSYLNLSLLGEAIKNKIIDLHIHNIRDFSTDKNKKVDDEPYGGGAGMIIYLEPVLRAIENIEIKGLENAKPYKILFTPKGNILNQKKLFELKEKDWLILICPRYEGIDERILNFIDEEISIGDYILSGGELPAMVLIEGITRLIPNVVGNFESVLDESFSSNLLECPQYTRPYNFMEFKVPKILLSGDEKKIKKWRRAMSLKITYKRRKELLSKADLTEEEKKRIKYWEKRDGE